MSELVYTHDVAQPQAAGILVWSLIYCPRCADEWGWASEVPTWRRYRGALESGVELIARLQDELVEEEWPFLFRFSPSPEAAAVLGDWAEARGDNCLAACFRRLAAAP